MYLMFTSLFRILVDHPGLVEHQCSLPRVCYFFIFTAIRELLSGGGGWSSYELEFSLHHPLRAPRAVFHRSAANSSPPRQHCPLDLSVVVEMVSR